MGPVFCAGRELFLPAEQAPRPSLPESIEAVNAGEIGRFRQALERAQLALEQVQILLRQVQEERDAAERFVERATYPCDYGALAAHQASLPILSRECERRRGEVERAWQRRETASDDLRHAWSAYREARRLLERPSERNAMQPEHREEYLLAQVRDLIGLPPEALAELASGR